MDFFRQNPEFQEVFRAQTLTASATTTFSPQFPLGEGWLRMMLRFNIAIVIGTGTGAVTEGELMLIKGITLRTDRGQYLCNNVPGRLLYRLSQLKQGTAPVKSAIAASTATYRVPIDIWFSEPKLLSIEEQHATILDTKRYGALTLDVAMGALSDLYTSVGTATMTLTLDAYVQRFRGLLPAENEPHMYATYGVFAPQNPNNQTFIDLEKSENLAYKRLLVMSTSGATAGVPMNGALDDTVISDMDVELTEKFAVQNNLNDVVQRANQVDYSFEAIPAGQHIFSFVDRSRSHATVLASGGQSRLRVNWRNQASLPSNPQVTVGYEGVRPL